MLRRGRPQTESPWEQFFIGRTGSFPFLCPFLFLIFPFPPSHLRLRNDLYCVVWGVKLYTLTPFPSQSLRNRHRIPISFFPILLSPFFLYPFRLQNYQNRVEWHVKLYSLTYYHLHFR